MDSRSHSTLRPHPQSLLALISAFTAVLAQLDLSQYASQPRWAQASLLLPDNSLLVYGGKVSGNGGYTYSSAPDTNDLLYLTLDSSFPANSPPWQYLSGSQIPNNPSTSPPTSYATLAPLLDPTTILSFGGSASSSSNLTGSDSSSIISLPSSPSGQSNLARITQQSSDWAQQPIRRIHHSTNSASGPDSLRIWTLGGQHADGSQAVFDELWQYSASHSSPQSGTWSACPPAPQAIYDHSSVTLIDSSSVVRLYVIGGMGENGKLVDMKHLYRFTPDLSSSSCSGVWETIELTGTSIPSPRRGLSVVGLSATQLMLFGGASASASDVYSDLWILDLTQLSWSQLSNTGATGAPSARWGHSMARVGQRIIITFGYGSSGNSQPAPAGASIFDLDTGKWTSTYVPSQSIASGQSATSAQTTTSSSGAGAGARAGAGAGAGASGDSRNNDTPNWQVPGSLDPVSPIPIPTPNSPTRPSNMTTIIGVTAALIGAAALVVGSIYLHRYQKRQKQVRRIEAEEYRRRAHGPDLPYNNDGHDDDEVGLVFKNESLHAPHIGVAAVGGRTGLKALAGVGAFWAQRKRKERFDMLADEESDIWDSRPAELYDPHHRSSGEEQDQRRKKYLDGFADRVRLPKPTPMTENKQTAAPLITTRGGLRIWRGLDDCSASSQIGFGTSTSFLGASLAPWSDDGRSPSIPDAARFEDPFEDQNYLQRQYSNASSQSTWNPNPFSDPEGGTVEEELEEEEESLSEHTALTFASTYPDSHHQSTAPLTPISQPPLPAPKPLDRRATWWDRFREKHSQVVDRSIEPIRDPAPPPLIPSPELEVSVVVADEHGRRNLDGNEIESLTSKHPSKSSNRTATSSMIQTAEAEMTVVQRITSVDNSPVLDTHSLFGPRDLNKDPPLPLPVVNKRLTAGTIGVKAIVEQFENGKEKPSSASGSGSGSGAGLGIQLGNGKNQKVLHGLVKKPILFVANPDHR
ncbi:hypothetical protein DFH28DRAFT_1125709 [Melampsora americana]|nr:hypothetical protein DFH28DRAFT_1125709 [Melampsora americana]